MEAIVTLRIKPRELDLIRTAIEVRQAQQYDLATGRGGVTDVNAETKRHARQEALELKDLLGQLR